MSSPQHITPESMDAYCRLFGIDNEDDILLLIRMLSALDSVWIEDWSKKEKARQKANSKPSSSGRRL